MPVNCSLLASGPGPHCKIAPISPNLSQCIVMPFDTLAAFAVARGRRICLHVLDPGYWPWPVDDPKVRIGDRDLREMV